MLVNLQRDFTEILSHCLVNNVPIETLWFQRSTVFIYFFVTQLLLCRHRENSLFCTKYLFTGTSASHNKEQLFPCTVLLL